MLLGDCLSALKKKHKYDTRKKNMKLGTVFEEEEVFLWRHCQQAWFQLVMGRVRTWTRKKDINLGFFAVW